MPYMSYETALFQSLIGTPQRPGEQISRYNGISLGVEIHDRFMFRVYDIANSNDQEALVDNPAAPTETGNGTEWIGTQIGGSTVTIVDTAFPPFLRIATGATDTQGQQFQAARGATGLTRTMFSTLTARHMFFSVTCRFSDANNNAATVEQMRFFAGFAPVDTSILAGVDDYIGFHKADGTGLINMVADQTSGVPGSGSSTVVPVLNMSTSPGANLINKWMTLTLVGVGLNRTAQEGVVHAFVDFGQTPTGAQRPAPTYRATMNLDTNSDCPGADMAPSIAFVTGEAVAKNMDITKIVVGSSYRLGV